MIHIITDSMSDLTAQEAKELSLEILPLHIHFEGESFQDNVTITRDAFYRRLAAAEKLPKTSQVTPDAFHGAYVNALAKGMDVLVITGSSELSGTHQSAVLARDMLAEAEKGRIYLVDTFSASLGQSLLLYEAARLRDAGESAQTIQKAILTLVPHQTLIGLVEDLKYLVMGGRLSSVGAKVGTVLRIKPMLRLKAGKLEMAGLARGVKNAYEWMAQQLRDAPPDPRYPVHFAGAHAPQALEALKAYLKEKGMLPATLRTFGIGAVIGAHTGPGCLAISWIKAPVA